MPTDLEQQLPWFAEALDREAPAISVDEILSRGAVAVDVDRVDRPSRDQLPRFTLLPWDGAMLRQHENGERDASIEIEPAPAVRPIRRRVAAKVALAVAAAAVLVVTLAVIVRTGDKQEPADAPTSTVPAPLPITTAPPASGGMWPQATVAEVHAAQQRADAGDPAYTWQVEPTLVTDDSWVNKEPGQIELVDRFLREVLGWDAYMVNPFVGMANAGYYEVNYDQRYIRCAPGRTNPLYPPSSDPQWGESCAPTRDDGRYESVSLNLGQLDRQDTGGIWVVTDWKMIAPFAQADPAFEEGKARQRLQEFLAARIAGTGAEGRVEVSDETGVPLLYATTTGTPYERYEIDRVDRPMWPFARMSFTVRLFAEGDATVVEQHVTWDRTQSGGLSLDANSTTENGQPVTTSYASSDGVVTARAPSTWEAWLPGVGPQADVWFGLMWQGPTPYYESGERIELVDPVAYDAWCGANGGTPLLSAPADAEAIAQQLVADANFETTVPVTTRIGGIEAVSIDVAPAPGGKPCGIGMIEISRWIHSLEPGSRLRLYLVDLPEGMSVKTLAITVVAPDERFDEFVEETAPIIDSIEFHPQSA